MFIFTCLFPAMSTIFVYKVRNVTIPHPDNSHGGDMSTIQYLSLNVPGLQSQYIFQQFKDDPLIGVSDMSGNSQALGFAIANGLTSPLLYWYAPWVHSNNKPMHPLLVIVPPIQLTSAWH
jgi:hypothetical protein